jgi:hypothetical protein
VTVAVIAWMAFAAFAASAAADTPLPPGLAAAIQALDAATVMVARGDIDNETCHSGAAHPAWVSADFDGDGTTDHAVLVRTAEAIDVRGTHDRRREFYAMRFVIFLGRPDGTFQAVTMWEWEGPLPLRHRVRLVRPGVVRAIEGEGKRRNVRLRRPGVEDIGCGTAASTYVWDDRSRRFDRIVTAD